MLLRALNKHICKAALGNSSFKTLLSTKSLSVITTPVCGQQGLHLCYCFFSLQRSETHRHHFTLPISVDNQHYIQWHSQIIQFVCRIHHKYFRIALKVEFHQSILIKKSRKHTVTNKHIHHRSYNIIKRYVSTISQQAKVIKHEIICIIIPSFSLKQVTKAFKSPISSAAFTVL